MSDDRLALTRPLAEFAAQARLADMPRDVVKRAREILAVSIASGIRASSSIEAMAAHRVMARLSGGSASFEAKGIVFGALGPLSRLGAATVNGACIALGPSHIFDETSGFAPGRVVVPSVIAAAEFGGCSGAAVLEGLIIGAEVGIRVARAVAESPAASHWSVEGVVGRLAAATATVKTLGGNSNELIAAVGLGGTQAAGLACSGSSSAGALLVGKLAADGFEAGMLSLNGWAGPVRPLEGDRGFFQLIVGLQHRNSLATDRWLLAKCALEAGQFDGPKPMPHKRQVSTTEAAPQHVRNLLDEWAPSRVHSFLRYVGEIESTDSRPLMGYLRTDAEAEQPYDAPSAGGDVQLN